MLDFLTAELSGRGLGVVLGLVVGGVVTGAVGRWRRHRERQSVLRGDARDTVVVHHHLVEPAPDGGPGVLRDRSLGQGRLAEVVPNGHLAAELTPAGAPRDAGRPADLDGRGGGSFLLETLTDFVCDRAANAPFDHALYVLAPCCEPADYQPVTVLLVAVDDLARFASWPAVRGFRSNTGPTAAGC